MGRTPSFHWGRAAVPAGLLLAALVVSVRGMAAGADEARLWSLRPVQSVVPPVVRGGEALSPVDRFLQARLDHAGLQSNPPADRLTLLRRVTFDLIGLPPSPAEQDAFLADTRRDAYERVVDRLLASPHFGERWGRHWLDQVRYAESNGRDRNVLYPHAWRYRDYVIAAFNADRPYDEFILEQLAGDLLPSDDPAVRDRRRIATGFLTFGPRAFEEMRADRFMLDVVDGQVDTTTRVFLGLTAGCARCHDHKFDPIPTRDYYALAGIFASTEVLSGPGTEGNQYGHDRSLQPIGRDGERLAGPWEAHQKAVAVATATRNKARSDRYRFVRQKAALETEQGKLKPESPRYAEIRKLFPGLDAEIADWDARIRKLDAALEALVRNPPPAPDYAMGVREAAQPADLAIRIRGDADQKGDVIPRGLLTLGARGELRATQSAPRRMPIAVTAVSNASNSRARTADTAVRGQDARSGTGTGVGTPRPLTGSGRLQLAQWIASPEHPLTARVFVNRVWQHLFGQGLVRTPDDFGRRAEAPSHPELLDWLAGAFVSPLPSVLEAGGGRRDAGGPGRGAPASITPASASCGWSLKRLIRLLVLTRAYRAGSAGRADGMVRDPENRLLWRMSPRRLEAEPLRDALLAVGGLLDLTPLRGSLVATAGKPELNEQFHFTPAQLDAPSRTVYLPVLREALPEALRTFDFADPSLVTCRRESRVGADQALFLLNGELALRAAEGVAARLLASPAGGDWERVDQAFRLTVGRRATRAERERAVRFVHDFGTAAVQPGPTPDRNAQSSPGQPSPSVGTATRRPPGNNNGPPPSGVPAAAPSGTPRPPTHRAWGALCHALLMSAEFRTAY